MRFDYFVSLKLDISRNKALELIENEAILLNDKLFKPAFNVQNYALSLLDKNLNEAQLLSCESLELKLLEQVYVSRAAFKLKAFLAELDLNLEGKSCLDIGASTGGFTQILLEKGVKSVLALDVGTQQLHHSLRIDERVRSFENMDIKDFQSKEKFDLVVCDISFTSLLPLLDCIISFVKDELIMLFKPQFEVGKEAKRAKNGVVKDEKIILKVRTNFEKECLNKGLILRTCALSKLRGKEGSAEYFYFFTKS